MEKIELVVSGLIISPIIRMLTSAEYQENNVFCDVDSNIAAWLPGSIESSEEVTISSFTLKEHLNNEELIDQFGGVAAVLTKHCLTLGHIKHIAQYPEKYSLITNQMANLFFTASENELYIVNLVYSRHKQKFTPYVYRIRNLYRSWSKTNQIYIAN